MVVNLITVAPLKLFDSGNEWRKVSLQVQGPATVYFGDASISTSTTDPTQLFGFTIVQADGIVQMWWRGKLYLAASAAVVVVADWR